MWQQAHQKAQEQQDRHKARKVSQERAAEQVATD
jgi:hypothetical protein